MMMMMMTVRERENSLYIIMYICRKPKQKKN